MPTYNRYNVLFPTDNRPLNRKRTTVTCEGITMPLRDNTTKNRWVRIGTLTVCVSLIKTTVLIDYSRLFNVILTWWGGG